ncbi:hypothetical protein [Chengkuizengella sediminis]|uniref:hypothetical protein n=1 Tax=Chengkuizengella sediminis TaxID=1885917 RepID=UPI00138A33F1|nr:hypothetical protein [Chengkuizengella sediminis]NDI37260.1 hypothetical protein [Chengkuizengella sediminis]
MRNKTNFLIVLLLSLMAILLGCSQQDEEFISDTIPQPIIYYDEVELLVYQSSYCWGTLGCADYIGAEEMLKEEPKTIVSPNTEFRIEFKNVRQPDDLVLWIIQDQKPIDIEMENYSFMAPEEEGIYFYDLYANWISSKNDKVSLGGSSYVFAIEVKL